jgi:hypothetical protein
MGQAYDLSQDRGPGPTRLAGSRHEAGKEGATTSYWRRTRAWVRLGPEHETQQLLCTQYGVTTWYALERYRETTDDTSSTPVSSPSHTGRSTEVACNWPRESEEGGVGKYADRRIVRWGREARSCCCTAEPNTASCRDHIPCLGADVTPRNAICSKLIL